MLKSPTMATCRPCARSACMRLLRQCSTRILYAKRSCILHVHSARCKLDSLQSSQNVHKTYNCSERNPRRASGGEHHLVPAGLNAWCTAQEWMGHSLHCDFVTDIVTFSEKRAHLTALLATECRNVHVEEHKGAMVCHDASPLCVQSLLLSRAQMCDVIAAWTYEPSCSTAW
jgi:hypothetical protein